MATISRKNHATISSTEILRHLDNHSAGSVHTTHWTVHIRKGETAWDPTSTKHFIHGPAKLTYYQYVDGGVEVVIESPEFS